MKKTRSPIIRHWSNSKLEKELDFAVAFAFTDPAGKAWLARLQTEKDEREKLKNKQA